MSYNVSLEETPGPPCCLWKPADAILAGMIEAPPEDRFPHDTVMASQ